MENDTSVYSFLETEESEDNFANCDFALRTGRHIQNHHHELKLYDYISQFKKELNTYYLKLYGVPLKQDEYHDHIYYYLDVDSENRGRFSGNRSDKLSGRHTLFGLLLLKIQRVDKYFGKHEIKLNEFKEQLKKESHYKGEIYTLFARVPNRSSSSETDEGQIDNWIDNSLKKFEELGWIYFDEKDPDLFEILPSFNRLLQLYIREIKEFAELQSDSNGIKE